MLRIGLTGGIGAGKSVARARFEELGALTVDYDALSRAVLEPGTRGLAAVVKAFGAAVLAADGSLDRAALARVVFADEEARRRLEGIVHPEVELLAARTEREARGVPAVVHDIPLLAEGGLGGFDLVIVVAAPVEVRVRRLVVERGMSESDARARIAAQADDDARARIADEILDGSGSTEYLRAQVDALWERIVGPTCPETLP